jgi:SAM-dependent methyltransferase
MLKETQDILVESYRDSFFKHGRRPEALQWSEEGQLFRFRKLAEIADLTNHRVLDLGCGLGNLYPFLLERFGNVDYTGIDIVPEMVVAASASYPQAQFRCLDILSTDLDRNFDYVLISGLFNNAIPNCTDFLKEMVTIAFHHCSKGCGFNFTSTTVNFIDEGMAYHDPVDTFDFCLKNLTPRVTMSHHYERCDVAVFAYR